MRSKERLIFIPLIVFTIVIGLSAVVSRSNQGRDGSKASPQKSQLMRSRESQYPIADYTASESADPNGREKRQAKGKKYDKDKSELTVDLESEVVTTSGHWASGLPAIPIAKSGAIIIGQVLDAHAYLSNNKKRVYSEFTIGVDEVLKNDKSNTLVVGESITADRLGGRVKLPSGKIGLYWVSGQGMPRMGNKYLLFLTEASGEPDFSILTGYEIRDGLIHLLDDPGRGHPISESAGASETAFLGEVRAAIASHAPSNKR